MKWLCRYWSTINDNLYKSTLIAIPCSLKVFILHRCKLDIFNFLLLNWLYLITISHLINYAIKNYKTLIMFKCRINEIFVYLHICISYFQHFQIFKNSINVSKYIINSILKTRSLQKKYLNSHFWAKYFFKQSLKYWYTHVIIIFNTKFLY